MISFEEIWKKIIEHEGEVFYTKTGKEFTYEVIGDAIYPSRTNYRIPKTDFRKAYQIIPISGPGKINKVVRGPSYIWAILHDKRINPEI